MKYLLATALRHIKKNAAVYLLIVIEITIGLAAVLCCRNILGGAKQQLAETKKELVGKNIEIEWRIPGIDINDPLIDGISYEKAMAFYEAFKNKADVCFAKKDINSFNVQNENGEWEGVAFRVMFVNDEMFEYFFGMPMRHDTVYADKSVYGEDVYGFISSAQENKKTTSDYYVQNAGNAVRILSTKDGELYLMSDIPIKIEHQPTPRVEITDGNGAYRQYTSETVFIPLDYYPLYMEKLYPIIIEYKNSPEKMRYIPISKLMLVFRNEDFDANFISQAVTYLEETDNEKGYIYTLTDEISDIQRRVEYLDSQTLQLRIAACSLLLMSVFCTAGVLMIFVNRRRKEMAVRMACGEGRARVAAGLFAELFCVTLTGAALGFLFAAVISGILKNGEYAFADLQNYMLQNAAISLGFALLCAAVPVLLAVSGVIRLQPARVLKGE